MVGWRREEPTDNIPLDFATKLRRDWRTDCQTQTWIVRQMDTGQTDGHGYWQTDMLQQQSSGGGGEHPQCRQCVKHNGSAPPEDPVWSLNPSCSFSSANTCFLIEGRLLNVGSRWLRSESIPRFGSQLVARQRASAGLTDLGYSWSLTPQLRLLALLLLPSPLRQTTFGPTIENDADARGRDGGGQVCACS